MKLPGLVFAVIATTASIAHAQYGTTLMQIPLDARNISMGGAGVADNSVPATLYFNPASVVASPRAYLDLTHQSFDADWFDDSWARRGDAGAAWKFDDASKWTFAANLGYSKLQWASFYLGGSEESLWSLALGAGYEVEKNWQVRVGGAIKRVDATVLTRIPILMTADTNIDGVSYDLGAATSFASSIGNSWSLLSQFGFSLLDHGADLEGPHVQVSLPTRTVIGASFKVASPLHDVMQARVPLFSSTFNWDAKLRDGDTYNSLGLEVAVAEMLFGRAGIELFPGDYYVDSQTTWGMGVGFPVDTFRLRLDYGNNTDTAFDRGVLSLLILKEL
jgi:hypothetical protein